MPAENIQIDSLTTEGTSRRAAYRRPRKLRSAAEQILNSPVLRSRLIAHEKVLDDLGNVDYHAGAEINPYGRDRKNPFRGGVAGSRVP